MPYLAPQLDRSRYPAQLLAHWSYSQHETGESLMCAIVELADQNDGNEAEARGVVVQVWGPEVNIRLAERRSSMWLPYDRFVN